MGYYVASLGADFNGHLESELGRKTRNPWPKGKMISWRLQVPGLEVVLLDGEETLQFAQDDLQVTPHREALDDGLAASREHEGDERAATAAAASVEELAVTFKGTPTP